MTTKLTKPVSRQIEIAGKGCFVVTLTTEGITLRKFRKRRGVLLPWRELAAYGLQEGGYRLTAEQWGDSLKTLGKLRRHNRLGRKQKSQ
jgi:hypothetical protein